MHNLPHHGKIITRLGGKFAFIFDVEAAVGGFFKPFRASYHHTPYGMFALNM